MTVPSQPLKRDALRQLVLRGVSAPLFILALLLVSAGRWDYWQAWLYVLVNAALLLANWVALRGQPDLIEERLKPGEGVKSWEKAYFALTTALYFLSLAIAGLDAGRFGWSGPLGAWVYGLGYAVYLAGHALFLWAKRVNRFFSTVVRIQAERGQTVCREGPYRYIRHPGYAGGILYMLAGPFVLGSPLAAIPQALAAALLVGRTVLEDRALQEELPGYRQYGGQVRYRLVPGLW